MGRKTSAYRFRLFGVFFQPRAGRRRRKEMQTSYTFHSSSGRPLEQTYLWQMDSSASPSSRTNIFGANLLFGILFSIHTNRDSRAFVFRLMFVFTERWIVSSSARSASTHFGTLWTSFVQFWFSWRASTQTVIRERSFFFNVRVHRTMNC